MILDTDGMKPIYIQIAEWLESEILHGNFQADDKVYSQYQLADLYNINPATAAKGLTKLAEEGILYDKRGLGKFVSTHAKQIIIDKRKNQTLKNLVNDLVTEAGRLELSEEDTIKLIRNAWKGEQG
ncbi:GntR family transcriptional regulator [Halobacillus aidingensis]|uniref:DNA-binding transcriptional regulator YhcF, GntR family n=1 Tax=Halobacillus aidingensis TaxID=240303 RepID=A0A1H0RLT8_HALAD|nr:GntR family transcriptional regulator [Halobacillus aidingensis]SDP30437.1 DNA-binding transcriptional regulator YhcF, GntR family [Halobacillus aidingensis]